MLRISERRSSAPAVDPLAEVADVDLDDVGVALEGVVPDVLQDLGLGDDLAGLAHQVLQQGELPGGEGDLDLAPPAAVGGGVEAQVADLEDRRPLPPAPAQQRPDAGHEHDVGEGLRQEVVGPGVEGLGLVELAVLGREHDDRRPVAALPERGADLVAVHARQHDVEDDGVVVALVGPLQPVRAVVGDVDREALRLQPPLDATGEVPLVFDHQDSHGAQLDSEDLKPR
jgi:hypothetical protein